MLSAGHSHAAQTEQTNAVRPAADLWQRCYAGSLFGHAARTHSTGILGKQQKNSLEAQRVTD